MNNAHFMDVTDPFKYLLHNGYFHLVGKLKSPGDVGFQSSPSTELTNDGHNILMLENLKELDYGGMVECFQNLDFSF